MTATMTDAPKVRKDPGTHTKSTLFIRNLPIECTPKDLEAFFSEWGPVRSAFPVHRPKEGAENGMKDYRGIGFVHFALAEDATRALEKVKEGVQFMGRSVVGELALRKHATSEGKVTEKTCENKVTERKRKSAKPVGTNKVEAERKIPLKKAKTEQQVVVKSPVLIVHIDGIVDFDKKQLYKKFRKTGSLKELAFPHETDNQAKLQYVSVEAAKIAYSKIHGHVFKGHGLRVVSSGDPSAALKQHRLIVRNLSFKANVGGLKEVFGKFGELKEVRVPTKPGNSKMGCGFAFVQFADRATAENAIKELNGQEVLGRPVAIDFALNKSTFEKIKQLEDETLNEQNPGIGSNENENSIEEENVDVETLDEQSEDKGIEEVHSEAESFIDVESDDGDEPADTYENNSSNLDTTVFIRNVPFSTEESELVEALSRFGKLEYCKIVRDPETGAGRGTAFAKFKTAKAAKAVCEASENVTQNELDEMETKDGASALETTLSKVENRLEELARKRTGKVFKSLITSEASSEESKGVFIEGRALSIVPAVDRKQAKELKQEGAFLDSGSQDRRSLYLLNETLIKPKTAISRRFWPAVDLSHRDNLLKERRRELKANPNLFISKARLSLRHLPVALSEAEIKRVLYAAVQRALAVADSDEGYPVIDEKLCRSIESRPHLRQVKIVKDTIRQRSKGYGFAEFTLHQHALLAVRYLANYGPGLWRELCGERFVNARHKVADGVFRAKAPIVEFATEKRAIVEKRKERLGREEAKCQ